MENVEFFPRNICLSEHIFPRMFVNLIYVKLFHLLLKIGFYLFILRILEIGIEGRD